jgi:choline dehydrogenase-like flavoprotein
MLGGGTAVNGMAYCRGAASVFDEWAEISGNPGLAWESLLEDFRETTHYADPPTADYEQFVNMTAYGDGPLELSRSSGLTGFEEPFASSVQRTLGLRQVDMNDGTGIGIDMGISSIFAGNRTRSYASSAYAPLVEGRPNLQILYDAWVSSVGFSGNTAVNVTYHTDNKPYTIKGKEIILSAGALNTPKLLLLSGVGPAEQLRDLGIPIVADVPSIGENLRDHALSIVQLLVTPEVLTVWQWSENETEAATASAEYAESASGPLGWADGFVYATLRLPDSVWEGLDDTHYTSLPRDRPHVLIQATSIPFIPSVNSSAVTAWASLVQPEASGRVRLQSADYRDDPLIYAEYYGTPADKAAIVAAYQQLREVLRAEPVSSLITQEYFPGPDVTEDDDVWAAIQQQTYSFRHPVGTVALGTALDSNWRLKGLEGIRVVDSSTFPFCTTCHPQSVLYALANRAAKDIIKADNSSGISMRYPFENDFSAAM